MSELRTNRIIPRDGLPSGSAGGIIQIVQSKFTSTKTDNVGNATDVTSYESTSGLFASITPTRADSKILIDMMIHATVAQNDTILMLRLTKKVGSGSFSLIDDATGDAAASRRRVTASMLGRTNEYTLDAFNIKYLDSPATASALTYSFRLSHDSGSSRNIYINRSSNDTSSYVYVPRTISTITLYEVSG